MRSPIAAILCGAGLATQRSRVRLTTMRFHVTTLGKLFVHVCLCHQTVACNSVNGRRCPAAGKVTVGLASHWSCVTDHLWAQEKGDEHPAYSPYEVWHTLPLPYRLLLHAFCKLLQSNSSEVRTLAATFSVDFFPTAALCAFTVQFGRLPNIPILTQSMSCGIYCRNLTQASGAWQAVV